MSHAGAATAGASGPWIRSPGWDAFWVLSPLWLAPLVAALATWLRGPDDNPFDAVDQLYLVLTALFWVGHRLSSSYLAYCTTAYRPLLAGQPVRFMWVPLAITIAVFAILLPPDDVYPLPRAGRAMLLVILDYVLVTYHFAAQHFGLLALYRARAGRPRDRLARLADRLFALGVGGALVLVAEGIAGQIVFQDAWVDPIVSPGWLEATQAAVRWGGTTLVAVATLAMIALELRSGRPSLPRLLYVVGLSGMVLTAFFVSPFLFLVLWTAQHWMAATGLASRAARSEPAPGPSLWYRAWHAVTRRPWAVIAVLALASFLLMPVMEVEALDDPETGYGFRLFPFLLPPLTTEGILPALLALGLTTGFVHYALDRAVWRFSDPDVREAARGVLS